MQWYPFAILNHRQKNPILVDVLSVFVPVQIFRRSQERNLDLFISHNINGDLPLCISNSARKESISSISSSTSSSDFTLCCRRAIPSSPMLSTFPFCPDPNRSLNARAAFAFSICAFRGANSVSLIVNFLTRLTTTEDCAALLSCFFVSNGRAGRCA